MNIDKKLFRIKLLSNMKKEDIRELGNIEFYIEKGGSDFFCT